MTFDDAFLLLIGHEGGYVNDPRDPGGETKFGISKRAYPMEDIRAMTMERAKVLYLRDYWGPAGCDAVPGPIRFDLFDAAVNSGPKTAVKLLQRAVGEVDDGLLGPRTLTAAGSMPGPRLVARFNAQRVRLITSLSDGWWDAFGRGLMRRIADNLTRA